MGFATLNPSYALAAAYLRKLIEELKASGFIREAMARSGLQVARVAPQC